jgi:hypothetical protein
MIAHNPDALTLHHRIVQRTFERRDRRGELSARIEARCSVEKSGGNHTGFGTRMVVAVGEAMVSLGQRLKERGMADSSTPVRVR